MVPSTRPGAVHWDLDNPYRYVEVRGRVVDTVGGAEALEHIHACSRRYGGRDYDEANITSERVILKIAPERVIHRGPTPRPPSQPTS